MAQSRHRHKHTHHSAHPAPHPGNGLRHKTAVKAVTIMMIFIGMFGVFVAWLSAGADLLWLAVGAVTGIVAGYFIGRSMDNAAGRK